MGPGGLKKIKFPLSKRLVRLRHCIRNIEWGTGVEEDVNFFPRVHTIHFFADPLFNYHINYAITL